MVAITNQLARLASLPSKTWVGLGLAIIQAMLAFELGSRSGWWWLGALVIMAIELRGWWGRPLVSKAKAEIWERLPGLVMAVSITLIIALMLREVSQAVVALLYAGWLVWRDREPHQVSTSLPALLVVQGVMFEAIFLMAATPTWGLPVWLTLVLVWGGSYAGVYGTLKLRGDRSAGVMAATWGVIATEVAWVLSLWLITYTQQGGYVLVPQPALILTALTYVFGSILASSRQGTLSRARLAEYMIIAIVLIAIVLLGTSWHGNP